MKNKILTFPKEMPETTVVNERELTTEEKLNNLLQILQSRLTGFQGTEKEFSNMQHEINSIHRLFDQLLSEQTIENKKVS